MAHMQAKLQRAARLFYERLPPPVQQQLLQAFRSMDINGDGRVSQAELMAWARANAFPSSDSPQAAFLHAAVPALFAFVDVDRNGTLDFAECTGLFFILCSSAGGRTCDGCSKLLLESSYTCVDCSAVASFSTAVNTFDLCSSCYAIFMNPLPFMRQNPRLGHPHRNMAEQRSALADAIEDMINQVQCDVCKEYHKRSAQGVFIQRHVQVGQGPREITVCEWCIACLCPACGNHYQGPKESAVPGRWAMQGSNPCAACIRQRGFMGGSPFPTSMLMKLQSAPAFEECSTCKEKVKNGTLVTTMIRSISTPRVGLHGTANPFNMFGSNSFGHTPHVAMPSFNPMGGSFGSSSFSTPNLNPLGSFGGVSGNNHDALMQMMGSLVNNGGSSNGNPLDVLNLVNNMGNPLNSLINNGGLNNGSPLDALNMLSNMGNPLDLLNTASMCSIM